MPRWRFWDRSKREPATTPTELLPEAVVAPRARGFRPPPPRTPQSPSAADPERAAQLERLEKRRQAVLFDVERAESAYQPDNPWQQRIRLLDEALATIEADLAALDAQPSRPGIPMPPVPIDEISVKSEAPARVTFRIGGESFHYEEEIDWAERGHQLARPELTRMAGDPGRLAPPEIPADQREALTEHLTASLFVFATDLLYRAHAGQSLPTASLADLARPCPRCGGWEDWHGLCQECQRRDWRRKELEEEAERLRADREREAEEQARWAERLPIARRRLKDVEDQIAALEREQRGKR